MTTDTIALMSVILAAAGLLLGVWRTWDNRLTSAKSEAMVSADNAMKVALAVKDMLQEHKTYCAQVFVQRDGVREIRDEIMSAVGSLRGELRAMSDRVDRAIEKRD